MSRAALFVPPEHRPVPLVESLGLELEDDTYVKVDRQMRTSRSRIWAAGDCTASEQAVAMAVSAGAVAAYSINSELTLPRQDREFAGRSAPSSR